MDAYYHQLLRELQANGFALVDLQLYLDTHPDDAAACSDFEAYARRGLLLRRAFEERYGPLLHCGESAVQDVRSWIESPWPWQV